MSLRWNRAAVRVASVGLLVVGAAGGIRLGQEREAPEQTAGARLATQVDADDMHLLKVREGSHAAERAWRHEAEGEAAVKAAAEARAAAGRARTLEKKVVARKAAEKAARERAKSASGATVPDVGPIPASCNSYAGNRAVGCALTLSAGFPIAQFPCLDKLFKKESGWNARAANAGSGAYGIPQALPGSKMASAGADWRTNPATQITWGLGYIKGRYGTPCAAWAHSESTGSY